MIDPLDIDDEQLDSVPEMLRMPENYVSPRGDFYNTPAPDEGYTYAPISVPEAMSERPESIDQLGMLETLDMNTVNNVYGTEQYSWDQKFKAFMETENWLVSRHQREEGRPVGATDEDMFRIERGWTSVGHLKSMGIEDEDIIAEMFDAETPSELNWRLNNLKRERDNRYIMSTMTMGESLGHGLAVSATDPLSWAMLSIPFVKGGMLARSAYGATIAASEAAAAEALLHTSQTERTLGESFLNVGATAVFGGVLGPLAGRQSKQAKMEFEVKRMQENLDEDMETGRMFTGDGPLSADKTFRYNDNVDLKFQNDIRDRTKIPLWIVDPLDSLTSPDVGPLRMIPNPDAERRLTMEQANKMISDKANDNMRVVGGRFMKALPFLSAMSPVLHASLAESHTARTVIEWMTDSALIKNKHFQGIKNRVSMDSQISAIQNRIMVLNHNIIQDQYIAYSGSKSMLMSDIKATKLGGKKNISSKEFRDAITDAYENGGKYNGPHVEAKEYIEAAAQQRHDLMVGEYEKMLVDAGVLKADNEKAINKYHADFEKYAKMADDAGLELEHVTAVNEMHLNSQLLIEDLMAKVADAEAKVANVKTKKAKQNNQRKADEFKAQIERIKRQTKGKPFSAKKVAQVTKRQNEAQKFLNEMGRDAPKRSFTSKIPFGSEWYLPRIFLAGNVARHEKQFIDAVVNDWLSQAEAHIADVKSPAQKARYQKRLDEMVADRENLEAKARQIARDIAREAVPQLNIEYVGKTNVRLKHRHLRVRTSALRDIMDDSGKKFDFIERDIMSITRGHVTAMTPDLVMRRNNFDMDAIDAKIMDEYRELARAQRNKGTKAGDLRAWKIEQEGEQVRKKIKGLWQFLNNDYRRPNDPTGVLNQTRLILQQYNMMRMLGSMTISAMTDLGNFVTHVGLRQSAGAFRTLVGTGRKLRKRESRRLGVIAEMVTASRLNALGLSDEVGVNVSSATRFMANRNREFTKLSLMNHWNAGLKEMAMLSHMDNIISVGQRISKAIADNPNYKVADNGDWISESGKVIKIQGYGRLSRAKLAAAGLDARKMIDIAEQFAKHGETIDGVRVSNIEKWKPTKKTREQYVEDGITKFRVTEEIDEDAMMLPIAEDLLAILKRQADMAIVSPGAGDLPLWMRTPVGGVIGQFKSFSFTAINRIMLPNMQRVLMLDPSAAVGATMQFGLGAMVYGLKMYGMGREDEIDTSWKNLVSEMVMRSGYFGILADVNAISHKVTKGNVSTQALLGGGDISRYYSRSFAGDLIGPTFSTLTDAGRAIGSAFGEEGINKGDLSAIRRMLPYQNIFYLRRQFSQAEEYAQDKLGL